MSVRRVGRGDLWACAALAAVVIASRLPFGGAILYHWDSVNFAFALSHFDVHAGSPHFPGYPVYVLLARAVNLWAGDPQRAMLAISAVSSGLAVAALYILGRTMFDRAVGLIAALLLAASPLYWFYGAIALPHSLDALMVIGAVWFLYRIRLGAASLTVPAAVWFGIAGGLRPQTQLFLAPLALYAGWRLDWRRRLLGLAVLAVVDLLWFVPLLQLNGGWTSYMEGLRRFNAGFTGGTSVFAEGGWFGLTRNLRKLGMYTLFALGGALLLVPAAAVGWRRGRLGAGLGDPRAVSLALWMVPSLAFYALIHMGQQGLVFVFLPALLLLLARAVSALPAQAAGWGTALAVAVSAVIFLAAPTFPLSGERVKLLTAATLRGHDAAYVSRVAAVTHRFAPGQTLIVSNGWRFVQYYLPGFPILQFGLGGRWERGEGTPSRSQTEILDLRSRGLSPGTDGRYRVVIFDSEINALIADSGRVQTVPLADGSSLAVLLVAADERLALGPDGIAVVPAESVHTAGASGAPASPR